MSAVLTEQVSPSRPRYTMTASQCDAVPMAVSRINTSRPVCTAREPPPAGHANSLARPSASADLQQVASPILGGLRLGGLAGTGLSSPIPTLHSPRLAHSLPLFQPSPRRQHNNNVPAYVPPSPITNLNFADIFGSPLGTASGLSENAFHFGTPGSRTAGYSDIFTPTPRKLARAAAGSGTILPQHGFEFDAVQHASLLQVLEPNSDPVIAAIQSQVLAAAHEQALQALQQFGHYTDSSTASDQAVYTEGATPARTSDGDGLEEEDKAHELVRSLLVSPTAKEKQATPGSFGSGPGSMVTARRKFLDFNMATVNTFNYHDALANLQQIKSTDPQPPTALQVQGAAVRDFLLFAERRNEISQMVPMEESLGTNTLPAPAPLNFYGSSIPICDSPLPPLCFTGAPRRTSSASNATAPEQADVDNATEDDEDGVTEEEEPELLARGSSRQRLTAHVGSSGCVQGPDVATHAAPEVRGVTRRSSLAGSRGPQAPRSVLGSSRHRNTSVKGILAKEECPLAPRSRPAPAHAQGSAERRAHIQEFGSLDDEDSPLSSAVTYGLPVKASGKRKDIGGGAKSCHCKKSQCLKLYCDCFAAGLYCTSCSCSSCLNLPEHTSKVMEKRESIMLRDAEAFTRKILPVTALGEQEMPGGRHKRGCNCKRSHCLKKYCECFQGNVRCTEHCKCQDCQNGAPPKSEDGGVAGSSVVMTRQASEHGTALVANDNFVVNSRAARAAAATRRGGGGSTSCEGGPSYKKSSVLQPPASQSLFANTITLQRQAAAKRTLKQQQQQEQLHGHELMGGRIDALDLHDVVKSLSLPGSMPQRLALPPLPPLPLASIASPTQALSQLLASSRTTGGAGGMQDVQIDPAEPPSHCQPKTTSTSPPAVSSEQLANSSIAAVEATAAGLQLPFTAAGGGCWVLMQDNGITKPFFLSADIAKALAAVPALLQGWPEIQPPVAQSPLTTPAPLDILAPAHSTVQLPGNEASTAAVPATTVLKLSTPAPGPESKQVTQGDSHQLEVTLQQQQQQQSNNLQSSQRQADLSTAVPSLPIPLAPVPITPQNAAAAAADAQSHGTPIRGSVMLAANAPPTAASNPPGVVGVHALLSPIRTQISKFAPTAKRKILHLGDNVTQQEEEEERENWHASPNKTRSVAASPLLPLEPHQPSAQLHQAQQQAVLGGEPAAQPQLVPTSAQHAAYPAPAQVSSLPATKCLEARKLDALSYMSGRIGSGKPTGSSAGVSAPSSATGVPQQSDMGHVLSNGDDGISSVGATASLKRTSSMCDGGASTSTGRAMLVDQSGSPTSPCVQRSKVVHALPAQRMGPGIMKIGPGSTVVRPSPSSPEKRVCL